MNRSRRFIANTIAGYSLIMANLLYTLLSVPLALHYLGKEEFGLWALALQITGYLMLLDLGLTSALSRFLADAKDHPETPEYARVFIVGCIVFCVQGFIIALTGCIFAFFASSLFGIPDTLASPFQNLLIFLSLTSGLTVAFRAIGSPLWAFQKLDVTYGLGVISLVVGLLTLWGGFLVGFGIYSFVAANIPMLILAPIITYLICQKSGFYPHKISLYDFDWNMFRRIFLFGKDVLLMSLGSQLVNASQIIILSRWVSLEAAATFSIGTKFFAMGQQFTSRIIESAAPGLTELFVRNEQKRFRYNFHRIFTLTGFLASVIGVALICGNTWLISIWTSGKIQWNTQLDVLLALLLIFTSVSRNIVAFFGIIAKLQPVRNVYFFEACVFVGIAIPAASYFGIEGILFASLIAHIAITTIIPIRAARSYLEGSGDYYRILAVAILIACVAYAGTLPWVQEMQISLLTLIGRILAIVIGLLASSWFVLTPELRSQMLANGLRVLSFRHR